MSPGFFKSHTAEPEWSLLTLLAFVFICLEILFYGSLFCQTIFVLHLTRWIIFYFSERKFFSLIWTAAAAIFVFDEGRGGKGRRFKVLDIFWSDTISFLSFGDKQCSGQRFESILKKIFMLEEDLVNLIFISVASSRALVFGETMYWREIWYSQVP